MQAQDMHDPSGRPNGIKCPGLTLKTVMSSAMIWPFPAKLRHLMDARVGLCEGLQRIAKGLQRTPVDL